MENEKNEENIQNIIKRLNLDLKENVKRSDENLDFEEANSAQVFEFGNEEKSFDFRSGDSILNQEPIVELKSGDKDFVIPDSAELMVDNETQDIGSASNIFATYVPRFTDVSETYRMVNDPRPRKQTVHQGTELDSTASSQKKEHNAKHMVVDVSGDDPTAELDEKADDAIIVSMSVPTKDEDADTLNVFKFSEEGDKASTTEKEWTVEDERAHIHKLISRDSLDNRETSEELLEPEIEQNDEPKEEKKYTIPDPDSGLKVVDYSNSKGKGGPAPDGVSEYIPDKGKKKVQEFELPIQRDLIKDKFLDMLMGIKVRLGAIIFFSVVMLAFELSVFFDWINFLHFSLFSFAGITGVIDALLATCVFLMVIPETVHAVKSLINGRLESLLLLVISYIVLVGYTCAVIVIGLFSYPLFGFMFSLFAMSAVLSTYFCASADFDAFKMISKTGEKGILEKKNTRDLPEENYALDGLVDEYKSRTARVFRAAFITDFFKRTSKSNEKSIHIGLVLAISFTVSLIVSIIAHFIVSGPISAFSSFALLFMLMLPAFMALSYKLSYRDAESLAVLEDSAVIGGATLDEFSEVDVICFEDSEIFGIDDVNLKRFMLYGDRDNMESVMRQMCSLFSVIKGPLYSIFANALDNRVSHKPATDVVIEVDGVFGKVSDKDICAGSEEYMLRHGIAIPEGAAVSERGSDTTKVMYAAQNGEVYAKFYIRYSFSEEFTMLLPSLKAEGIVPLIYTSDPNISNELLRRLTAGSDCIRAMKRLIPGSTDEKIHNRVSSGVVTIGDRINMINLLLLSRKYDRFIKKIRVSEMFAMGLGAVLGSVLALIPGVDFPIALLGLWQIFWCVVLRLASKNVFLKGKKKNNDIDDK